MRIHAIQLIHRTAFAVVLGLATAAVMLPVSSVPAQPPAATCCAEMTHQTGNCPPPAQGPVGNCCNVPLCLHLFLQTGEENFGPTSIDVEFATFVERAACRAERPAVPPPRFA